MEIRNFDKEFVERTKKIIERPSSIDDEYNITLLINCMLALIALPTEKTKCGQKGRIFRIDVVNEMKRMNIIEMSTDDEKSFRTIKNALSHMNIEIKNRGGSISEILFWDKYPSGKEYHTILKFNPQQLRAFALFVADKHIERLTK